MTIYDVPVHDTVFFPVSGDMLRRMKHDEETRLKTENDPGDPAKNHTEVVTDPNTHQGERTIMTIISDPALAVHRDWCEPTNCTVDRSGINNDGDLEVITHRGPQYGFVTEPDPVRGQSRITVQVEEFNNLQDPESAAIALSDGGAIIDLKLYELQRLRHLLSMAEEDLLKAMSEHDARHGEAR